MTELDPFFNRLVRDFQRVLDDEGKPCPLDDLPLFRPSPDAGLGRGAQGSPATGPLLPAPGTSVESPGPVSSSQGEQLARVSDRIGAAITAFCTPGRTFHADELRAHVTATCGAVAPGSADRILRLLRQQGTVSYEVLNRRRSLYRITEG